MDHSTFLVTVFCLIDDWFKTQPKLRQRGPQPKLMDSEVLTIEVVGEFMGIDTDTGLYTHFRRDYGAWFPMLRQVHRTTFVRQASNLRWAKEHLWQALLGQLYSDPALHVVDSFPVPVCRLGRAWRVKRFRAWSAFGFDDVAKATFYGLRAHVLIAWPGVIVRLALHPAALHDRWVAEDLLAGCTGWALGDTNYWSPFLQDQLAAQGLCLLAPRKTSVARWHHPWPRWLIQLRRRVETVIGQLTERYHAKRVWARDPFHLAARWLRKLLSHTVACLLCQQAGLSSLLQFAELVTE
jgi:hypothetical protein